MFSRPKVIEHSRQYLLLRTDTLKKTVVGCTCLDHTLRTEKSRSCFLTDHTVVQRQAKSNRILELRILKIQKLFVF